MDVKEFFEKYSIDEISKKTKISPISLEYIKNREFEKLAKVKFLGFLKIIENEFKVNLDELREEYNNFHSTEKREVKEILENEENSPGSLWIVIFALLFLIGGSFYYLKNNKSVEKKESNEVLVEKNSSEKNFSVKKEPLPAVVKPQIEKVKKEKEVKEELNDSKPVEVVKPKKTLIKGVVIIPHKKLWFKAINLDTHNSGEFLISSEKNLTGKNYYLKLGHGLVTIEYNDKNISPNTKKIVRILLKDGNYSYLPKHNRFEK